MIAEDLLEERTAEAASVLRDAIRDSGDFQGMMVASAYHIIVEALIHPYNATATLALRKFGAVTDVEGRLDPVATALKADVAAALAFLGLVPVAREPLIAELEATPDAMMDKIKNTLRPIVEEMLTEELEAMPVAGKPN